MLLRVVFGLGIRDIPPVGSSGGSYTPPTVDAGGPYNGLNTFNINGASFTAGSDPNPVISWSLVGPPGTVGTFTNGDTISPTFTWTEAVTTPITVQVTVQPNDGGAVTDTALLNIVG